jgi:hypothetical protein
VLDTISSLKRGIFFLGDNGDIFHVPLVLLPYEGFALGTRLCGNMEYGRNIKNHTN